MEKFQTTDRDNMITEVTKMVQMLKVKSHLCYHCDRGAGVSAPPYANTLWEERTIYVCRLEGMWIPSCWVQHPNGEGYCRVIRKGESLFVSEDVAKNGDFFEFYRAEEW